MAVGGIKHDDVDLGLAERFHSLEDIGCDADAGAAEKTSLGILGCIGVLDVLFNILNCDQTDKVVVIVDDGKLFLLGTGKDLLRLLQRDPFFGRDKSLGSHRLADLLAEIGLKFQVSVGDDADELSALCDRNAGDPELAHQVLCIQQSVLGRKREGIGDNAVLRALDLVHFLGLCLD